MRSNDLVNMHPGPTQSLVRTDSNMRQCLRKVQCSAVRVRASGKAWCWGEAG